MSARMARVAARRRAGRRRATATVGVLGLLGIGLGVGAAVATTAAWTDQVWWAGDVTTGTADLQGSLDGVTWVDSNDAGAVELLIPALSDLRPGDTVTTPIHVRNVGDLSVEITGTASGSGALFTGTAPVTAALSAVPATLAGGSPATALLTVTAPEWTGQEHMGESGAVTVTLTGAVP